MSSWSIFYIPKDSKEKICISVLSSLKNKWHWSLTGVTYPTCPRERLVSTVGALAFLATAASSILNSFQSHNHRVNTIFFLPFKYNTHTKPVFSETCCWYKDTDFWLWITSSYYAFQITCQNFNELSNLHLWKQTLAHINGLFFHITFQKVPRS